MEIESWININNAKLGALLGMGINAIVESSSAFIDRGSNIFDIEAVVDQALGNL